MATQGSVEDFINFIFNSNPTTKLDHSNGYTFCAVGLYANSLGAEKPHGVVDILEESFQELEDNPTVAFYVDLHSTERTLMQALDSPRLMNFYAPTMGDLQTFIVAFYPNFFPS